MRTKKWMFAMVAAAAVFTFAGCAEKKETVMTAQEQETHINELYEQENEILNKNQELWNTVFSMTKKEEFEVDPSMNYADFLAELVKMNQDAFSEDEKGKLEKDIAEIRKIEEKIVEIASLEVKEEAEKAGEVKTFPGFTGKDLDGNDVDDSIFSENKVTVINLWFNGCQPCVQELPELEKISQELKEKGGELIGINAETLDGNETIIKEAKEILAKKGVSYRNIYFDSSSEAGKYVFHTTAFPTTLVVDQNRNIVGNPIIGGVDTKVNYEELMRQIDTVLDQQ